MHSGEPVIDPRRIRNAYLRTTHIRKLPKTWRASLLMAPPCRLHIAAPCRLHDWRRVGYRLLLHHRPRLHVLSARVHLPHHGRRCTLSQPVPPSRCTPIQSRSSRIQSRTRTLGGAAPCRPMPPRPSASCPPALTAPCNPNTLTLGLSRRRATPLPQLQPTLHALCPSYHSPTLTLALQSQPATSQQAATPHARRSCLLSASRRRHVRLYRAPAGMFA